MDELRAGLRESYGRRAGERDGKAVEPWKAGERRRFLGLLRHEGKSSLLELGAGPGKDGGFFRDHGLDVVCTDLSPEMVAACEGKGLTAYVMDLSDLSFPPATFDAVYALNCLLHLPGRELPRALRGIRDILKPGGLFYLGVYGGRDHEGVWEDDPYEPKRFFSFHTDGRLREIVGGFFEILSFEWTSLEAEQDTGLHFQSLVLRKRSTMPHKRLSSQAESGQRPRADKLAKPACRSREAATKERHRDHGRHSQLLRRRVRTPHPGGGRTAAGALPG